MPRFASQRRASGTFGGARVRGSRLPGPAPASSCSSSRLTMCARPASGVWPPAETPLPETVFPEAVLPETVRLEVMDPAKLSQERERWVLKSDYGAEGDEVIVGRLVDQKTWDASLLHAVPGRWVAQRYFEPLGEPLGDPLVAAPDAPRLAVVEQVPDGAQALGRQVLERHGGRALRPAREELADRVVLEVDVDQPILGLAQLLGQAQQVG